MKHTPPFLVVADQTHLQAYFADESEGSFDVKSVDRIDFPAPAPETSNLPHMATRISELLQAHKPDHWGFAAPADLNEQILNLLDDTLRRALTCNVRDDLTKIPAEKLPAHFVQPEVAANAGKLPPVPGAGDTI
jgi:hypothetical protein